MNNCRTRVIRCRCVDPQEIGDLLGLQPLEAVPIRLHEPPHQGLLTWAQEGGGEPAGSCKGPEDRHELRGPEVRQKLDNSGL
eukprot:scaffold147637_cov48-Prasinocladus_malaysianus.AAC.1